ncbi:MAG: hypothetical protein ACJA2S_000837 [Cyclobacteriaceae bacterium]|jgi:hypothetical protein
MVGNYISTIKHQQKLLSVLLKNTSLFGNSNALFGIFNNFTNQLKIMTGNKINQKATESYSKSFSSKVLENSFPSSNAISGQQILDITPVKQVNFFILKIIFLQWQEETKKFQSPFFDYSKPEVKDSLKNLVNTLSKNILIKKDSFKTLLETAVLETLTLMYQPSSFFIKEFSNLPNVSRIQGFKGLSKYIKIRKGIYNQIIQKLDNDGNQVITDDEVKPLVQLIMSQYSDEEDLNAQVSGFSSILELDIFEREELVVEKEEVSSMEILIEEEVSTEIEKEPEEEEMGSIIIEEDDLDDINQDVSDQEEDVLIETDDYETIREEIIDEEYTPILEEPDSPSKDATINETFSEETPTVNEKFENESQHSSIVEVHETEKISEIQKNISVNQRYMFLNDLFGGDSEEYEQALNKVENSDSFDDSVELLVQNYSKKYEWDMNSDEVKELLKVIFKRFR